MHALVVGGNSQIGAALIGALVDAGWQVTATSRRSLPLATSPVRWIDLDLAEFVESEGPKLPSCDVAFVCAAISKYADCRADVQTSHAVNVRAPQQIAQELSKRGGRTVFLSTSAVFDGSKPRRQVEERPDGRSVYGRQKAEAEKCVLAAGDKNVVLRLTKVLSTRLPLFVNWIERLNEAQEINPFRDMVLAPIGLDSVVEALVKLETESVTGILQLSACRDVSYADVALHIAKRIGVSRRLVVSCSARESGFAVEEVPANTSLDATRCLCLLKTPVIEPLDAVDSALGFSAERCAEVCNAGQ